jgi:hypothetical protein
MDIAQFIIFRASGEGLRVNGIDQALTRPHYYKKRPAFLLAFGLLHRLNQ